MRRELTSHVDCLPVRDVSSPAAQPSHPLIAPGGTLRVAIGATHQGPPLPMDVYVVVLLPDGDSVVTVGAGALSPGA
jgi:hypothetical protein